MKLQDALSCISGYDADALSVDQARAVIGRIVQPVAAAECVALRSALDRVLAHDIVSPIDVPAHDNSAMDGYAL
ncbi:MAG: molybdopterin molybdenumtransferase MoeA, partial [Betaproteobacteria bacterium]|nr:molybdopterin molybdenumtransferase MoeA [Betaproteobacteria bacterium]